MAKPGIHYSTMNAGKLPARRQAGHNYRERGVATPVYIARGDARGEGRVHSRIRRSAAARC